MEQFHPLSQLPSVTVDFRPLLEVLLQRQAFLRHEAEVIERQGRAIEHAQEQSGDFQDISPTPEDDANDARLIGSLRGCKHVEEYPEGRTFIHAETTDDSENEFVCLSWIEIAKKRALDWRAMGCRVAAAWLEHATECGEEGDELAAVERLLAEYEYCKHDMGETDMNTGSGETDALLESEI